MATQPVNLEAFAQSIQNSGCIALRDVARELTRLLDDMLAPTGVRATELGILRVCAASGPISVQELAHGLEATKAMAQRGVGPLVQRGMLILCRPPGHRTALLELTPEGRRALLAGIRCWDKVQARLMQQLGEQRWERIQQQFAAFAGLSA